MDIQKWNWETHQYEPYSVPAKYRLLLYCEDMEQETSCASCFKPMKFGNGYTSRELHNHIGLGYPVCEDCYTAEWKRYEDSKSKGEK